MRQLETDVVVVAEGTAGLAASVAAIQHGVRVIGFEKASTTGGTGNMAMGPFAVESTLQRVKKINLSKDEAFKIFMDFNHWRSDARLIRAYIEKSGNTIDWLEKLGVEFADVPIRPDELQSAVAAAAELHPIRIVEVTWH